jgi:hypothetical protein
MRLLSSCLLLALCLTAFAEEPYSFRIMTSFQDEGRSFVGMGMSVPVKVKGRKLILTALHVVMNKNKEADEILVDYPEGWIRCKIVRLDPGYDLCLLEPRMQPPFVVDVAKSDPKQGDDVINPNFYETNKMVIEKGKVENIRDLLWDGKISHFRHGSSGSPMIDKSGKLVGLGVAGTTEDKGATLILAICVGTKKIREFFDRSDEK